jgi:hypothetical protein
VGPTAIYRPFCQTSTHHSGSPRCPFFKPSSATGSASRHLHHRCPWDTFYPEPPGCLFFISWSGTHAHCHICQIHAHIFDSLQILFTLGIWLLYAQVLAHRSLSSSLQVYIHHWHVVSPVVLHLHFQSHPLILAFRTLFPGSAVPTPPFASSVLLPGSTLTHMSCPIHSTFWHFLTLMLFFITL